MTRAVWLRRLSAGRGRRRPKRRAARLVRVQRAGRRRRQLSTAMRLCIPGRPLFPPRAAFWPPACMPSCERCRMAGARCRASHTQKWGAARSVPPHVPARTGACRRAVHCNRGPCIWIAPGRRRAHPAPFLRRLRVGCRPPVQASGRSCCSGLACRVHAGHTLRLQQPLIAAAAPRRA